MSNNIFMPASIPDVVLSRECNGEPNVNIPPTGIYQSPNAFEWGHVESDPTSLAFHILLSFLPFNQVEHLYHDFKWDFLAEMPFEGGIIKGDAISAWLQIHMKIINEQ